MPEAILPLVTSEPNPSLYELISYKRTSAAWEAWAECPLLSIKRAGWQQNSLCGIGGAWRKALKGQQNWLIHNGAAHVWFVQQKKGDDL
jgi:hypothetical protein